MKYLEVGSYKGSTMAAAICGNGAAIQRADSVEDFSEFDGAAARDLLRKNVRKCESSAVEESSRRKSRKQRMFVEGGSGSPPPPPPPPFAGVTFHESRFQNPALLKGGLADSGFNLYLYEESANVVKNVENLMNAYKPPQLSKTNTKQIFNTGGIHPPQKTGALV